MMLLFFSRCRVSVKKKAAPRENKAPARAKRNIILYPSTGTAASVRLEKEIMAPIATWNKAPPKKGKRLTIPTAVPAMARGKSSLETAAATAPVAPERVKQKKST